MLLSDFQSGGPGRPPQLSAARQGGITNPASARGSGSAHVLWTQQSGSGLHGTSYPGDRRNHPAVGFPIRRPGRPRATQPGAARRDYKSRLSEGVRLSTRVVGPAGQEWSPRYLLPGSQEKPRRRRICNPAGQGGPARLSPAWQGGTTNPAPARGPAQHTCYGPSTAGVVSTVPPPRESGETTLPSDFQSDGPERPPHNSARRGHAGLRIPPQQEPSGRFMQHLKRPPPRCYNSVEWRGRIVRSSAHDWKSCRR
jgi:hypothetical protein